MYIDFLNGPLDLPKDLPVLYNYQHPVTYHMRIAHPGCGRPAGGRGYNSGGNYCGGWAGNCGDGGVGGSSWYLICEKCREAHQGCNSINIFGWP